MEGCSTPIPVVEEFMEDDWPILDFSMFKNEMISGLTSEEIKNHMHTQMGMKNKNVSQLQPSTSQELCAIPVEVEKEMKQTETKLKPTSSANQEKYHVKKFQDFLLSKDVVVNLDTVSEENLDRYLRWFYHENRKKDGGLYSPESLKCIRAALHRYITQTLNRKVNIIDGDNFMKSNRMLKTMTGLWLKQGGSSNEFIAIEEIDMEKIVSSFDRKTGEAIQNEVIFSILYFLGSRGREEFRRLKRSDICFSEDSEGRFVYIKKTDPIIQERM